MTRAPRLLCRLGACHENETAPHSASVCRTRRRVRRVPVRRRPRRTCAEPCPAARVQPRHPAHPRGVVPGLPRTQRDRAASRPATGHGRLHRVDRGARRRAGEPAVPAADHRGSGGADAAGVLRRIAVRRADRRRAALDRRRRPLGRGARRRGRCAAGRRARGRLCPRGAADPVRELLHMPWAGCGIAPARAAAGRAGRALRRPRRVRRSGHRCRRRRGQPAHSPDHRRRPHAANALPARLRELGDAGPGRRRVDGGGDRDPAALDRSGR